MSQPGTPKSWSKSKTRKSADRYSFTFRKNGKHLFEKENQGDYDLLDKALAKMQREDKSDQGTV